MRNYLWIGRYQKKRKSLTNSTAEQSPYALDFKSINLINYDFDKYGSSDLRKRLITKWVDDVKLAK